jgi:formate dehydrogenase major subunit
MPATEVTTPEYPYLLNTGRTLYQFNAGTMTMRTQNTILEPTDMLSISPTDASRLGILDNDEVVIESRYGKACIRVAFDSSVRDGELFSTFTDPRVFINRVTGNQYDSVTFTPQYKVTAVKIIPLHLAAKKQDHTGGKSHKDKMGT